MPEENQTNTLLPTKCSDCRDWETWGYVIQKCNAYNAYPDLDTALSKAGPMQIIRYVLHLYVIHDLDDKPKYRGETIIIHDSPRILTFRCAANLPFPESEVIGDERVKFKNGYLEFMDMGAHNYEHHCELYKEIGNRFGWLKPYISMPQEQKTEGGVSYISLPSE